MKNLFLKLSVVLLILITLSTQNVFSQGIMISDNSETEADASAVLEIQSTSKGLLIPRLTSSQRNTLTSYAKEGLLVYDVTLGSFFIYGKTSTGSLAWNDLSTPSGIWQTNSNDVYLANPYTNVGIGTSSPNKKLVIQADNAIDTLLEILDENGKPLMIITPTLTKFYFNETSKKGAAGGFAVGRYASAKAINDTALFIVTPDSTRVYTSASSAKGVSGGFAVGRYASAKGESAKKYFYTGIDSTRVYTDGNNKKGAAGGFAVGRYASAKAGSAGNYMYMVPENYFIGHESGNALQNSDYTGKYNTFFGYKPGLNDTSGRDHVFIGYESGLSHTTGSSNTFVGRSSGRANIIGGGNTFVGEDAGVIAFGGNYNTFLGYGAGAFHGAGDNNIYIGKLAGVGEWENEDYGENNVYVGVESGKSNTLGLKNVFIGYNSGYSNTEGQHNVFVGDGAGYNNLGTAGINTYPGNFNVFVGYHAGYANTTGQSNVYIGEDAAHGLENGKWNTFIGKYSGYYINTGKWNVLLGAEAGQFMSAGQSNVLIGNAAGGNSNAGNDNVIIGNAAGFNNDGTWNGAEDLSENVIIGKRACFDGFGTNNVILGYEAGYSLTPVTSIGNVFIGNKAGYDDTGSYKLYIDNSYDLTPLIYGEFDNHFLRFNANVGVGVAPSTSYGVYVVDDFTGVYGHTPSAAGAYTYGVMGRAGYGTTRNCGIYGATSGTSGINWAGYFNGDLHSTGTNTKASGAIKIDHPLDPENKILYHSSVESPDMMNIYNGNIKLNSNGEAIVIMADYFEALNMKFRYQLTAIGIPGPNLYIKEKINGNKFMISGGKPNMEVSWQITGIRHDPYANKNRIKVEKNKNEEEKGKYLHPKEYNQPKEKGVDFEML